MPLSATSARVLGPLLVGLCGMSAAQGTTPATPPAATPARPAAVSAATARDASRLAVEISGTVRGQIISCPRTLRISPSAVCLYVQATPASLRPLVRGKLGTRALSDWKTAGQASSLPVAAAANGPLSAYILLTALSDRESLMVVDTASAIAAPAGPRPATPAGAVRGQPYVLGSDLVGVVSVAPLGGGKFRLTGGPSQALTVTVGQKTAQLGSGTVELPLVPVTDGRNLIFPLAGLRSLGCTFSPAGSNVTVACGTASVGLRPIVF